MITPKNPHFSKNQHLWMKNGKLITIVKNYSSFYLSDPNACVNKWNSKQIKLKLQWPFRKIDYIDAVIKNVIEPLHTLLLTANLAWFGFCVVCIIVWSKSTRSASFRWRWHLSLSIWPSSSAACYSKRNL